MKPLVEAMRSEGKSLVIAPEGTRAPTRKLGAFKKGGFHVAIQSGVPIVPVVIHNSSDISPKGDKIFRSGTVKVDLLPAIDTGDWSVSTIDEHVTHVRNLFLKTLGQPELSVEETVALRRDTPEDLRPEVRGQRKSKSLKTALTDRSQKKRSDNVGDERLPEALAQVFEQDDDPETPATRH